LQILGDGAVFLSLSELAERSGMSPSTTHRVVRSLVDAGLVGQDPRTSRYSLGPEIVRLSEGYLARIPIVKTAAPYLVELRALTKATVLVALLRGDHTASIEPTLGSVRTGVPTAPLPQ
jgi:IclR family acetate operon transcriptional repressor